MQLIRRQQRLRSVVYPIIAFTAALMVGRPAMAQDEGTVTRTAEPPFSASSTAGSEAAGSSNGPAGAQVQVTSNPAGQLVASVASEFATRRAAAAELTTISEAAPAQQSRIERNVETEARKLQLGVRGGVALDPELIDVGVQVELGPIVNSNVFFRPSVEFAYGEVTAMFGFNGEFIYRLPRSSAGDRWSPYFGGGLGINLLHQNFEREGNGKRIDFGDFHSDSALNILGGVRHRNGLFLELRTSVYSDPSPTLRLAVGYTF